MAFLSRLIKNKLAQQSAKGSLNLSADVPTSGVPSIQNSAATSKTSAEVIPYLQQAFEDIDPDSCDAGKNFSAFKIRLGERIARYRNVGFSGESENEWNAAPEAKRLVQVAIECSVNVYDSSTKEPQMQDLTIFEAQRITASLDAVTKATKIFEVHGTHGRQEGSIRPLLVIAIRGTVATSFDWTVNLNTLTTDAQEFLGGTSGVPFTDQRTSAGIKIHDGFLTAAKRLLPTLLKHLESYRSTPYKHVLFTGHSAGGAIASLVFINILNLARTRYPEFRFSSITFGAPPITSSSLTAQMKRVSDSLPNPGISLAIINEDDPITRMDGSYVKSILNLYNGSTGSLTGDVEPTEIWRFPKPDLYIMGDLIVLQDTSLENSTEDPVVAYETTPEDLSQCIFCDFNTHGKAVYLDRVDRPLVLLPVFVINIIALVSFLKHREWFADITKPMTLSPIAISSLPSVGLAASTCGGVSEDSEYLKHRWKLEHDGGHVYMQASNVKDYEPALGIRRRLPGLFDGE